MLHLIFPAVKVTLNPFLSKMFWSLNLVVPIHLSNLSSFLCVCATLTLTTYSALRTLRNRIIKKLRLYFLAFLE
jgi:hypothetical protein